MVAYLPTVMESMIIVELLIRWEEGDMTANQIRREDVDGAGIRAEEDKRQSAVAASAKQE